MLPNATRYAIYPAVVQEGKRTQMAIIPHERIHLFHEDTEYLLKIIAINSAESAFYYDSRPQAELTLTAKEGVLRFDYVFTEEQEYLLRLYRAGKLVADLSLYALEAELFSLLPLRGDLHTHSFRSDGGHDPAALAGHFREQGYDFFCSHRSQPLFPRR